MQFGNPYALFGALLSVPIVACYLLRTRRRRLPVATLMFWTQAVRENRSRAWWQRLRHPLSLAVQLLILTLLVLALADPRRSVSGAGPTDRVIVIDNSASMQARDVRPTRLHWARRRAARWVSAMRMGDRVAILTAGSTPRVQLGWTDHPATAQRSLQTIRPSDGPTRLAATIQLAQQLVAGRRDAEIIVLTDRPRGEFPAVRSPAIRWVHCGQATDNLAITAMQVRRERNSIEDYHVLVDVAYFVDEQARTKRGEAGPRRVDLVLSLDGRLLDVVPLDLLPNAPHQEVIHDATTLGGVLTARLDGTDDALDVDDLAYAVLPPVHRRPVYFCGPENLFLLELLRCLPDVQLHVASELPATLPADALVVLYRYQQADPLVLPERPTVVIEPLADTPWYEVGSAVGDTLVTDQQRNAPMLAHVMLRNMAVSGARQLRLPNGGDVLVRDPAQWPILVHIERPTAPLVVINLTLERGELPLRAAFPVLMTNLLRSLQVGSPDALAAYPSGRVVTLAKAAPAERAASGRNVGLAEPVTVWSLVDPAGKVHSLPIRSHQWSIGPLDQVGLWKLVQDGSPVNASAAANAPSPDEPVVQRLIACNLANAAESNLVATVDGNDHVSDSRPTPMRLSGLSGRPGWFLLTLALFAGLFIEWHLYQQRWIE